jgi:pSer/pThr/pTyr-binding forkhead associated (FHA) protein|tara:strand:- start:605 stop:1036 length:432 start_codon:yes stop_codon:yes gene_type:complete
MSIEPKQLEDKIKNLRFRWQNATKQYIATYPDFALGLDKVQNSRAYQSVLKTKMDINVLQATLKGLLATTGNFIDYQSNNITQAKKKYEDSKLDLETAVGNNKSGKPMKIDKYNENSKAYILASYYTIGILSTSFFIYKQLKQ